MVELWRRGAVSVWPLRVSGTLLTRCYRGAAVLEFPLPLDDCRNGPIRGAPNRDWVQIWRSTRNL